MPQSPSQSAICYEKKCCLESLLMGSRNEKKISFGRGAAFVSLQPCG